MGTWLPPCPPILIVYEWGIRLRSLYRLPFMWFYLCSSLPCSLYVGGVVGLMYRVFITSKCIRYRGSGWDCVR